MRDLISRQRLMECVNEGWIKFDTEKDENKFIHLVRDMAPSAQPERKKGKWIGKYPVTSVCSECNYLIHDSKVKAFAYCPNCGADMRGEQE